jgi:hypothetical protein
MVTCDKKSLSHQQKESRMYFVRGKDRLVLAFPALGIVIKFPMIHLWRIILSIIGCVKDSDWKRLGVFFLKWNPEHPIVFSGLIFKGVLANRRERTFWKQTHHPFLQPTIFSFFGLFNLQMYANPYRCNCYLDLWDQIRRITEGKAYANPHQFSEPENFCVVEGKLRILDYGGKGGPPVILKYGQKIQDEFDFQFHYSGPL